MGNKYIKKESVLEFFEKYKYNYLEDFEEIRSICLLTKTRKQENVDKDTMPYGSEQPFILKCLAENLKVENYFEIGTGRGTSAYVISNLDHVKKIITSDILDFDYKRTTAVNYSEKFLSNQDIFDLVQLPSKEKINFIKPSDYKNIIKQYSNKTDLAFIDGNHTNPLRIYRDFIICKKLLKKEGVLVFDDYNSKEFMVKSVVDWLVKRGKIKDLNLVNFHGHLFHRTKKRDFSGMVICKIS